MNKTFINQIFKKTAKRWQGLNLYNLEKKLHFNNIFIKFINFYNEDG